MRKQRQTKSLIVEERGGASFGVLPFFCRKAVLHMVKGAQTIAQYKIMRWIDALGGKILDREGARV